MLVVVDQPATIGALAVAVAQDMGITVGYLPGLSMRRIADLTPGSAKTDAKDAAVIAGAARTMPHTLRAINASDEEAAALSMLTGFDLDLGRLDRLGPGAPDRGGRRHQRSRNGAAPPGPPAHRPARSAGRCHPPQAGDPGGWPTLMCQVLTTRARDQGSRPPPSSWPRP